MDVENFSLVNLPLDPKQNIDVALQPKALSTLMGGDRARTQSQ